MVPLDKDVKKEVKALIGTGRKAVGMAFNVEFGVRMPTKEESHKKAVTWRRSLKSQGQRHDLFWERIVQREYHNGSSPFGTVDERIENDKRFRLKLARKVVGCKTNYAPAQILMSQYCRSAFTKAIELGEMSYENIGNKGLDTEPRVTV